MAMEEDPYTVLNLPRTASAGEIKRSFRDLALKHHPDKNPLGSQKFKSVNRAYQILSDERTRKEFDDAHPIFRGASAAAGRTSTTTPAAPSTPAAGQASVNTSSYAFRPQSGATGGGMPTPSTVYPGTAGSSSGSANPTNGGGGGSNRPGSASAQRPASAFKFPSAEQTTFTSSQQFREAGMATPATQFHYASSTGGFTPRGTRPQSSGSNAPEPAEAAAAAGMPQHQRPDSSAPSPRAYPTSASAAGGGASIADELASMRARHEAAQKVDMSAWDRIRRQPLGTPPQEAPPPSSTGGGSTGGYTTARQQQQQQHEQREDPLASSAPARPTFSATRVAQPQPAGHSTSGAAPPTPPTPKSPTGAATGHSTTAASTPHAIFDEEEEEEEV